MYESDRIARTEFAGVPLGERAGTEARQRGNLWSTVCVLWSMVASPAAGHDCSGTRCSLLMHGPGRPPMDAALSKCQRWTSPRHKLPSCPAVEISLSIATTRTKYPPSMRKRTTRSRTTTFGNLYYSLYILSPLLLCYYIFTSSRIE